VPGLFVFLKINYPRVRGQKYRQKEGKMKMFLKAAIMAATVVLGWAAFSLAAQVQVIKGDSLWAITQACGLAGARWPELYAANPGLPAPEQSGGKTVVWIYPGQVLTLPEGWGTDRVDTSKLEVVKPNPPAPSWWERVRRSLAEFWGWVNAHPWSWGLLGLLGLLGLMGRRQVQVVVNNHYPALPAPPAPSARRLVTVPDCRVSLVQAPAGLRQSGQVRYDL